MFTPSLLSSFSWTGVSRTEGLKFKQPFQIYKGILVTFTQIIYKGDDRWTLKKTNNFIKDKILRHAKAILKKDAKKDNDEINPIAIESTKEDENNDTIACYDGDMVEIHFP